LVPVDRAGMCGLRAWCTEVIMRVWGPFGHGNPYVIGLLAGRTPGPVVPGWDSRECRVGCCIHIDLSVMGGMWAWFMIKR
jgi:hypothetical protein